MIRGLAEIVLSVHDLEASLRFYRDTLGLTLVSEPGFRPVFLRAGDPAVTVPQLVVLVPLPPQTPPFPTDKPSRPCTISPSNSPRRTSTPYTTPSPLRAMRSVPGSTPSSPPERCTWTIRTATRSS